MARGNPNSAFKRQIEKKKSEKREAKAREKEDRRRRLDDERARVVAEGEDSDLAGIVAGPQPVELVDEPHALDADDGDTEQETL